MEQAPLILESKKKTHQVRFASEHTFSIRYQGQVYMLKSDPASTAGKIISQFRKEHGISRFTSLELRLDDKAILYKDPVRLGYSNTGSALEIVPRSFSTCI